MTVTFKGRRAVDRKPKPDAAAPDAPAPAVWKAPGRLSQSRTAYVALALCLAIVGGLLAYFALGSSAGQQVLVVKGEIKRGSAITADRLGTITVTELPEASFKVEQSSNVIGKIATADLPDGTLIVPGAVAEGLGLQANRTIVGVAVEASQAPSRELRAGDRVRVVYTPADGNAGTTETQTVAGTVDQVRSDAQKGLIVVDVDLAVQDAPKAARWSSAKAASIVLDGTD